MSGTAKAAAARSAAQCYSLDVSRVCNGAGSAMGVADCLTGVADCLYDARAGDDGGFAAGDDGGGSSSGGARA